MNFIDRLLPPGFIDRPMGHRLGEKEPTELGVQAVSPYSVVGVDVSSWQGAIDWSKLATKIYFAFIRAGRGNDYFDTNYSANVLGAIRTGRAYGIYWYMIPRSTSNWKNHLANIISVWEDSGSKLPPVMDFEETPWGKSETTNWIIKVLLNFYDQTGTYPMIYTSSGWWNTHVARNDYAKKCLLWQANWTSAVDPVPAPYDWSAINQPKTWEFWQYTSSLVGSEYGVSSTKLDGNRYHYSLAQFNSKFKTNLLPLDDTTPPPPPPPPPDEITPLYKVRVTAEALNIRAADNSTSTDIGTLKKDSEVPVVAEKGDWLQIDGFVNKNYTTKV